MPISTALRRRLLQIGIKRGVDAVRLVVQLMFAELVDQRVAHHVDEIGRVAGFHVRRRQLEGRGLGLFRLFLGDGVGLHHRIEHQVAPLQGALGMPVGRQPARPLDDSRQQRRLGQRNVFQVLIEIGARCFAEAANGERSALPQVHPIAVELENLLLAELLFQLLGDQHLCQLASDSFFRRQEKAARKLHGDGRAALLMALPHHVDPYCLEHAGKVHATVLEESPVFDREHRIYHHFRDVAVLHHLALGTLFSVEQRRHQLRLQLVCGKLVALAGDMVNLPALDGDVRLFRRVVAFRPGRDLDAVAHQTKAAQQRLAFLIGIPRAAQKPGDFLGVQLVAVMHGARQGIDLGRIAEHRRPEALLNNAVVLDVEVAQDSAYAQRSHQENDQRRPNHRVARQPAPFLGALGSAFRDLDLNGHV
jgi:hypothetical protein